MRGGRGGEDVCSIRCILCTLLRLEKVSALFVLSGEKFLVMTGSSTSHPLYIPNVSPITNMKFYLKGD